MPRDFDSDEVEHDRASLRFTEFVTCPHCGVEFEGVFTDDAMSVQDITDAPQGTQRCPGCGYEWCCGMSGWTFYGEAG